jgi:hypothetical protein
MRASMENSRTGKTDGKTFQSTVRKEQSRKHDQEGMLRKEQSGTKD